METQRQGKLTDAVLSASEYEKKKTSEVVISRDYSEEMTPTLPDYYIDKLYFCWVSHFV